MENRYLIVVDMQNDFVAVLWAQKRRRQSFPRW